MAGIVTPEASGRNRKEMAAIIPLVSGDNIEIQYNEKSIEFFSMTKAVLVR